MKGRKTSQRKIAYLPLQEIMEAIKAELGHKKTYVAMTLLTEALEVSTLLLCLKHRERLQPGLFLKERDEGGKRVDFPSLTKKNDYLFNAGIYDEETKQKIGELVHLRNTLFHGHVESGWVKNYDFLDKILYFHDWLDSFIDEQGLRDYQLKEGEIYL